jgi:phosphoenolpyruvate carboxykinase (ATP)
VNAVLNDDLSGVSFSPHPVFKVLVPQDCPGVPADVLDPKKQWQNPAAYDQQANALAERFIQNFSKLSGVEHLVSAGPTTITLPS